MKIPASIANYAVFDTRSGDVKDDGTPLNVMTAADCRVAFFVAAKVVSEVENGALDSDAFLGDDDDSGEFARTVLSDDELFAIGYSLPKFVFAAYRRIAHAPVAMLTKINNPRIEKMNAMSSKMGDKMQIDLPPAMAWLSANDAENKRTVDVPDDKLRAVRSRYGVHAFIRMCSWQLNAGMASKGHKGFQQRLASASLAGAGIILVERSQAELARAFGCMISMRLGEFKQRVLDVVKTDLARAGVWMRYAITSNNRIQIRFRLAGEPPAFADGDVRFEKSGFGRQPKYRYASVRAVLEAVRDGLDIDVAERELENLRHRRGRPPKTVQQIEALAQLN